MYPEDHGAILENVHAIARAFVHSEIDDRKASILDRLMNTALRTLRQRPRLEKTVTSEEMIRHFRMDEDGNPRAIEPPTEVPPAKPEPVAETAEPAILPAISAEAEESCGQESDPAELQRIASSQNLSLLLSTLADEGKLRSLLSNTYIFRNGKLIVAPIRARASHPDQSERRASAYIFLTNVR